MKSHTNLFLIFFMACMYSHSQSKIKITLASISSAAFEIKQNKYTVTDSKFLDFAESGSEISVDNKINDDNFSFSFIDKAGTEIFAIAANKINKSAVTNVPVSADRKITSLGATGTLPENFGIIVKYNGSEIAKLSPPVPEGAAPPNQPLIVVQVDRQNKATIALTQGGTAKSSIKELDFTGGNGQVKIINKSTDEKLIVFFNSSDDNSKNFSIPSNQLTSIETVFAVDKDGKLPPAITAGSILADMGMSVKNTGGELKKLDPAKKTPATVSTTRKPGKPVNDNSLYNYVEKQIDKRGYKYIGGQSNLIMDEEGVIHIFLDGNGNPIKCDYPVSAKENFDKFQFHIISADGAGYVIESSGEFSPIEISEEIKTTVASTQSDDSGARKPYSEFTSPIFGPYTGSFPFTITRGSDIIVDRSIKLLKTSRVSLNTGVIASWLQTPGNIATFVKPNGDTTLIADNPTTRGFIGLVLTFHLVPRNLNVTPRNLKERFGFSVGTNINAKAFDNFFFGLNWEVTNGLFINAGAHYGQVTYVINHNKFNFGSEKFSGNLQTRKIWNVAPYVSINIDAALFAKVFKNILTTTAN